MYHLVFPISVLSWVKKTMLRSRRYFLVFHDISRACGYPWGVLCTPCHSQNHPEKLDTLLVLTVFFLKTNLFLDPERNTFKKLSTDIKDLETRNNKKVQSKKFTIHILFFLYSRFFFPPESPGGVWSSLFCICRFWSCILYFTLHHMLLPTLWWSFDNQPFKWLHNVKQAYFCS